MKLLTSCAFALCSLANFAMAEPDAPVDVRESHEIRSLSKLPPALAKALGWQGEETDTIVDLERISKTQATRLVNRWFLLGALAETHALIAVEARHPFPEYDRFHVTSFLLINGKWTPGGEWIVQSQPHAIADIAQLIRSPESRALTAKWQKWQRDQDLNGRMAESDPAARYRRIALREVNISDIEVRQIQAVVQDLMPGAIVAISGVAKGCPCEDGPGCSAQVWTAIYYEGKTTSLELSDINEHWVVGPVQQWYIERAKLARPSFPSYAAYSAAQQAMNDRYPVCSGASSSNR
jgi:hypothetical protein